MKTKMFTTISLGIGLYVVLSYLIPIRVIGNYFLCLGYAVMVIYPYMYGQLAGLAVGFFGTALYCLLAASYNGMVGWVLGNAFIGFFLGLVFQKTKQMTGATRTVIDIVSIIVLCGIGIAVIKSVTETVLFSVPLLLRLSANVVPFAMDALVMLVSYPIALVFDRRLKK